MIMAVVVVVVIAFCSNGSELVTHPGTEPKVISSTHSILSVGDYAHDSW